MQSEPTWPAVPPSIANLAQALATAQGMIKPPVKNKTVDFADLKGRRVNYSYADLADVIEAVREPFSKNGLSVVHQLGYRGDQYGLTTLLIHSSGESLPSWYPLPHPGNIKPQEFGSAITYARRYSLSGIAGIASEEDDDGQAAADAAKAPRDFRPAPKSPRLGGLPTPNGKSPVLPKPGGQDTTKELSEAQLARLFAIAAANGWTKEIVKHYMVRQFNVTSSKELNREQYDNLIKAIESEPYSGDPGSDPVFDNWNGPGGPSA